MASFPNKVSFWLTWLLLWLIISFYYWMYTFSPSLQITNHAYTTNVMQVTHIILISWRWQVWPRCIRWRWCLFLNPASSWKALIMSVEKKNNSRVWGRVKCIYLELENLLTNNQIKRKQTSKNIKYNVLQLDLIVQCRLLQDTCTHRKITRGGSQHAKLARGLWQTVRVRVWQWAQTSWYA